MRPERQVGSESTRVLIAGESRLVAEALMHVLELDPRLEPIGYALDAGETIDLVSELEPDVVLVASPLVGLEPAAFAGLLGAAYPSVTAVPAADSVDEVVGALAGSAPRRSPMPGRPVLTLVGAGV